MFNFKYLIYGRFINFSFNFKFKFLYKSLKNYAKLQFKKCLILTIVIKQFFFREAHTQEKSHTHFF